MNENNLTQMVPSSNTSELMTFRDPQAVLVEAKRAAVALRDVITQKKNPVVFNKEQYLEYEDWQLLGQFCGGITAKASWTRFVDFGGGVKGFEAGADAVDAEGRVRSSAEAMCLNDEENWGVRPKYDYMSIAEAEKSGHPIMKKYDNGRCQVKIGEVPVPLFQLRSMAQTRACAKALNNCLRWVAVLANFAPTPAEEMTGYERQQREEKPTVNPPQQKQPEPTKNGNGNHKEPPLVGTIRHIKNVVVESKDNWTRFDIWFEGDPNKYSTFSTTVGKVAEEAWTRGVGVVAECKSVTKGKYSNWQVDGIEIIEGTERKPEGNLEPTAF